MDEFRVAVSRRGSGRAKWIFVAAVSGLAGLAVALFLLAPRSGQRAAAPEATPPSRDLEQPGWEARPPAVEARPSTVAAALRAGRFAALETLFAELTAGEAADPARREIESYLASLGLRSAEPELEELLLAWRKESPSSPYAALALALHYDERGWRARGHGYAADTPQSAWSEYREWRSRALPLARTAVDREPKLATGWVLLVNLALGEPGRCLNVAGEGLKTLPASWRIRWALMNCLKPRWGGRYEAMQAVATEAQRHADRNPRLQWLLGSIAVDRASLARDEENYELAERWSAEALATGSEEPGLVALHANDLVEMHRATEALEVASGALAKWPEEPDLLRAKMRSLSTLGRRGEIVEMVELLAAVDPGEPSVLSWRRWLSRAQRKSCESLTRGGAFDDAILTCLEATRIDPQNDASLFWLGRAYLGSGQYDEAQRVFEQTLRLNPRHREAIVNLDWLHGRRRDWQPVLELWNAYIELEPGDARAWLERAGTHRQLGDGRGACTDLAKACELGSDEACTLKTSDC